MLPPHTEDLRLDELGTVHELLDAVGTLWVRADKPSLRDQEKWALANGKPSLGRTTIGEMRRGNKLPGKEVFVTFVEACGVPEDELAPWQRAWERIAPFDELAIIKAEREALWAKRREEIEQAAQAQADTMIAEAQAYADEVVAEAKRAAGEMLSAAAVHMRMMFAHAAQTAASTREQAREQAHAETSKTLRDAQAALDGMLAQGYAAEKRAVEIENRAAEHARSIVESANLRAQVIVQEGKAEIDRRLVQVEVDESQAVRTIQAAETLAAQIRQDAEHDAKTRAENILGEAKEVADTLLKETQKVVLQHIAPRAATPPPVGNATPLPAPGAAPAVVDAPVTTSANSGS